ncbi:MAG: M50 family metallopeptidase [Planctomycetales bacterium]|nr:M50 family metallopeptidase [bacterium]UNM07439.1 MAG: M50 family metallopeptidase [Planctomycetales bacterium]
MSTARQQLEHGKARSRHDGNQVWGLLIVFVIVLLLWNTVFIAPLKLLVVFFHELSHAIAAIITGGKVHGMELNIREGGLTYHSGGNFFLIASAGYLGSMLWGAMLILAARFVKRRQVVTFLLGLVLLGAGLLFMRPIFGFGFIFCLVVGFLMLFLASRAEDGWHNFLLKLIGITSCLYAVLDIKSDILDRPHLHSDAVALQQLTLIPSVVWGVLWMALSIACTWWCLRLATRRRAGDETGD